MEHMIERKSHTLPFFMGVSQLSYPVYLLNFSYVLNHVHMPPMEKPYKPFVPTLYMRLDLTASPGSLWPNW